MPKVLWRIIAAAAEAIGIHAPPSGPGVFAAAGEAAAIEDVFSSFAAMIPITLAIWVLFPGISTLFSSLMQGPEGGAPARLLPFDRQGAGSKIESEVR